MKRSIAILLTLVFLLTLCPVQTLAADPAAGTYSLFTLEMGGKEMDPALVGLTEGSIVLSEDGTGTFSMNGEEEHIAAWSVEGNAVSASNDAGSVLTFTLEDGVLKMDLGGGAYLYFTPGGHGPLSRVSELYRSIDAAAGAHLDYEYHSDYMDSTSIFDVHAGGGRYYSLRTTKMDGVESLSATLYLDGKCYNLYPDEKRGSLAVAYSSSLLADNILLMDELFKDLYGCAFRKDFSEEKREIDGVSYTVEVFPAVDYNAEIAFYFDDAGQLVHVLKGAPVIMPELGETFYTVRGIDGAVNEALFDITGYEITE